MNIKNYEISSVEVFDENAFLDALGGCSDYNNEYGLNGFQVDFVINDKYRVVYQSEERNNGMRNYAGWEMSVNSAVDDDYAELEKELGYDWEHDIFKEMEKISEELAKKCLENLLENV